MRTERKEVEKLIEEYKEKQEIVQQIKNEIDKIHLEFTQKIQSYETALSQAEKDMNTFGEQVVSVSLGDLVEELSNLTEIPIQHIGYDIEIFTQDIYHKKHSLPISKDMLYHDDPVTLELKIVSNKEKSFSLSTFEYEQELDFCYKMSFKSLLNAPQADGKTLFDHTYTYTGYIDDMPFKGKYTALSIKEQGIYNIICNFSLYDLAYCEDYVMFHPKKLLLEAVLNIIGRQKESKKRKVKVLNLFHH